MVISPAALYAMVETMNVEGAIRLVIAAHDLPDPLPPSIDEEGTLPTQRPVPCSGS